MASGVRKAGWAHLERQHDSHCHPGSHLSLHLFPLVQDSELLAPKKQLKSTHGCKNHTGDNYLLMLLYFLRSVS